MVVQKNLKLSFLNQIIDAKTNLYPWELDHLQIIGYNHKHINKEM